MARAWFTRLGGKACGDCPLAERARVGVMPAAFSSFARSFSNRAGESANGLNLRS